MSKKDVSKEDVSKKDVSKEDVSKKDVSKKGVRKEDVSYWKGELLGVVKRGAGSCAFEWFVPPQAWARSRPPPPPGPGLWKRAL